MKPLKETHHSDWSCCLGHVLSRTLWKFSSILREKVLMNTYTELCWLILTNIWVFSPPSILCKLKDILKRMRIFLQHYPPWSEVTPTQVSSVTSEASAGSECGSFRLTALSPHCLALLTAQISSDAFNARWLSALTLRQRITCDTLPKAWDKALDKMR